MESVQAIKSVKQPYQPSEEIITLLKTYKLMVNACIDIGLRTNTTTLKRLSKLAYGELRKYDVPAYYKLCAISQACGILTNRKKSIRRGFEVKKPYYRRLSLTCCYGFKIKNGSLYVPLGDRRYFEIKLNDYVKKVLSDPALNARSFILTSSTLSICYSKEVMVKECTKTAGLDRNLRAITYGNEEQIYFIDVDKITQISENTRSILSSFKRNDVRIRKKIYKKYSQRKHNRIKHILHNIANFIIKNAEENNETIVVEKLNLRQLYTRKASRGKGKRYRYLLNNAFPYGALLRIIEYKALWKGIKIIKVNPKYTSLLCPACGKRTQEERDSRLVYCKSCDKEWDRDIVASLNLAYKGRCWFHRSEGLAGEAMMRNEVNPLILRVDASKLSLHLKTLQNLIISSGCQHT